MSEDEPVQPLSEEEKLKRLRAVMLFQLFRIDVDELDEPETVAEQPE